MRETTILELIETEAYHKAKRCSIVMQAEVRYQLLLANAKKEAALKILRDLE